MDLEILKTYLNTYGFDDNESVCMPMVDCNFEYDKKNYCLCLVKSIGTKYSRIEEFIPVAIYNSLESIYRDDSYEGYVEKIEPEPLKDINLNHYLSKYNIILDIDTIFLIYDFDDEKIFVGKLKTGTYFSLSLLNPDPN